MDRMVLVGVDGPRLVHIGVISILILVQGWVLRGESSFQRHLPWVPISRLFLHFQGRRLHFLPVLDSLLLDWWNEVCRRLRIAMAKADAWLRCQFSNTFIKLNNISTHET